MSRVPVLLVVVTAGLVLAGCGGSGEGSGTSTTRGYGDPVAAAQEYVDAFGAGDFAAACEHIAAETLARVTEDGATECEQVYEDGGDEVQTAQQQFEGAEVGDPQVDGDQGTVGVTTSDGSEIRLVVILEDGAWKVAS